MPIGRFIKGLFGRGGPEPRFTIEELGRRLDRTVASLRAVPIGYHEFDIPKRRGGTRRIAAPNDELKQFQRLLLRRVFARLRAHPAAIGFEKGGSTALNAQWHVGKAVVLRMDIRDFFTNTTEKRVREYLRFIGWDKESANFLVRVCCHKGGLPQGAPTSPRLANLVNHGMDASLAGLAAHNGATYTRYADDLCFSFVEDVGKRVQLVINGTDWIVFKHGYYLHTKRKLRVARQHQQQCVTGIVVNRHINVPRRTRRWLRAVEHHHRTGKPSDLTPEQLEGWKAYVAGVDRQRDGQL